MIRARLVSRRLRRLRLPLPAAILLVGLSGGLAWASESEDLGIESTVTTVATAGGEVREVGAWV